MTTLQESAMRLALAALTSTDALPYEDWMRASGHPAIKALNAALAQQELPQKERPDFMAGYDAGMTDAKRMAQQGEQRCTYCDGTGDVHGIDGEWRGSCPCAAAPAPQAQEPACPECGASLLYECVACSYTNYPKKQDMKPQAQNKSNNYLNGYCTGRTDLLKEQAAPQPAQGVPERWR